MIKIQILFILSLINERFVTYPDLVDIGKGQIHSDLHEIYFKGPRKEREIMKFSEKFGPATLNETHVSTTVEPLYNRHHCDQSF